MTWWNIIYEFDGEGTPTGTSIDITGLGYTPSGFDVGDGYLWVINDGDWSVVRLDRDSGMFAGEHDISEDGGAGNPTGMDYIGSYLDNSYVYIIDSGYVNGHVFPVPVDVGSGGYSVDGDDTYLSTFSNWWSLETGNDSFLWQGLYGGIYDAEIALRFVDIEVAQGATITSATLRLLSGGSGATGSFGTLYGSNTDDAPAWSESVYPDTITKTVASTPFVVTATTFGSMQDFDVTDIVQEIVNRFGWQSGNAMAFAGDATGSDANSSNFISSEAALGAYPQLLIETDGDGEEDPPARELRLQGGVRLMDGVRLY